MMPDDKDRDQLKKYAKARMSKNSPLVKQKMEKQDYKKKYTNKTVTSPRGSGGLDYTKHGNWQTKSGSVVGSSKHEDSPVTLGRTTMRTKASGVGGPKNTLTTQSQRKGMHSSKMK